jgi:hypothetical protein
MQPLETYSHLSPYICLIKHDSLVSLIGTLWLFSLNCHHMIVFDYLESSENQSFSMAEVNLHTTVRDTEDKALPLIEQLETDGYIRKVKSRYEIIKNPW